MRAFLKSLVVLSSFSLLCTACGGVDDLGEPLDSDVVEESDAALSASQRAVVFTLSNEEQNAVLAFRRASDGTLSPAGSIPTGGKGSGGGLGSQGALAFSKDYRWLFAVNAGSNQITSFEVYGSGLVFTDLVDSGGERPVSLTVKNGLLYVAHAGGGGNITGFRITPSGHLRPIANSTRPLSAANAGPAQVEFSPDGSRLVVTEKATNKISSYQVQDDGTAVGPLVSESRGMTPFGFTFSRSKLLIVSEAFGGAPGKSATSSYRLDDVGSARVVSGSVANGQGAACWAVATKNGAYAFISNTGSGTITRYIVDAAGGLHLGDDGRTGLTGDGSRPADMALSSSNEYLYVVNPGTRTVGAFHVSADGGLTALSGASNLPASIVGLVAR